MEGSLQYVSRLYYVGPQAKETAIKCLEGVDPDIVQAFGWPRVDLWMPSKHHISNDAVKKIHAEFGDGFLLFSSDFGINSQRLLEERSLRLELFGAKKTKYELEFMRKQQEGSYRSFVQFLDLLREMDSDSRIPMIIVRPHPAEDHKVWLEKTSDLKKTKVVYQGEITPWLLASKGLLHRGCTTAIQASISEVKTGFLASYSDTNSNSIVPQISPNLHTLEDVAKWANSDSNEASYRDNEDILKDHISFSARGATETIATDMMTLTGDCVSQSSVRKKSMLRKALVKLILSSRARRNKTKAKNPHGLGKLPKHNKMQDGIASKEIKNHLNTMYPQEKFHVVEVINDLCFVEITGQ